RTLKQGWPPAAQARDRQDSLAPIAAAGSPSPPPPNRKSKCVRDAHISPKLCASRTHQDFFGEAPPAWAASGRLTVQTRGRHHMCWTLIGDGIDAPAAEMGDAWRRPGTASGRRELLVEASRPRVRAEHSCCRASREHWVSGAPPKSWRASLKQVGHRSWSEHSCDRAFRGDCAGGPPGAAGGRAWSACARAAALQLGVTPDRICRPRLPSLPTPDPSSISWPLQTATNPTVCTHAVAKTASCLLLTQNPPSDTPRPLFGCSRSRDAPRQTPLIPLRVQARRSMARIRAETRTYTLAQAASVLGTSEARLLHLVDAGLPE